MNMWYWVLGFKWRSLYQPSPLSVKLNWKNLICKLFIILELNDWRSVLTDDLSAVGLHFDSVWGMIMAMLFLSRSYWSAEWQFGWSDIHHSQKSLFFIHIKSMGWSSVKCLLSKFMFYYKNQYITSSGPQFH